MYRVATFLLEHWWGKHPEMSDALAVLLLTWNQAFYRYGLFDAKRLEECLAKHWDLIEEYHAREIETLSHEDYADITLLFTDLLDVLGNQKGKSPVSVGKGLHLLAPRFFPIWDRRIAAIYGCAYDRDPAGAYLRFCDINKQLVESLRNSSSESSKTLLKRIDEYNYVKFSKGWID